MNEFEQDDKIDCECTDDLVCPYCGHRDDDTSELAEDGQPQCTKCEKWFTYDTYVKREFISKKADCLNGSPHDWHLSYVLRNWLITSCRVCGKIEQTKIVGKKENPNDA